MYERIYRLLQPDFDPNRRVRILRSSEDPGLAEFFKIVKARGATSLDPDGTIFVQIDDADSATKGTWLEEFAHALQFLQYGNIVLSIDDRERAERELEVARCLLNRSDRLKLSEVDIEESKQIVQNYGKYDDDYQED